MSEVVLKEAKINKIPTSEDFLRAVDILTRNPHALNKKLSGVVKIFERKIDSANLNLQNLLKLGLDDLVSYLKELPESNCGLLVVLNQALYKNPSKSEGLHIVSLIEGPFSAWFIQISKRTQLAFKFYLKDDCLVLSAIENEELPKHWLEWNVFPKFSNWIQFQSKSNQISVVSHSLIDSEEYNVLYNRLKDKYGTEMVKIWPESTDPQKFVYEDVAIATYLILLWKAERKRLQIDSLQSFVDLGCGNGLLVYILSSEGHSGVGIDLRRRKIWDLYPSTTVLRVETITPSHSSLFPTADWIIGNHSDELSPWIPVIAARSSFRTRFFLLPCCAYEFNGAKFQRRNGAKSVYNDFLDYVADISRKCGFEVNVDRLKIPSTKRICIIGERRTYEECDFERWSEEIQRLIGEQSDFKAREVVEKVRNCTQIDRTVVKEIVLRIFRALLEVENGRWIDCWNAGGSIHLSNAIDLLTEDQRKVLKSECGGLQTLLRNNHDVFEVQNGQIRIRIPLKVEEKLAQRSGKPIKVRQKDCFFYFNHPNSCLLGSDCSFKHPDSE